MLYAGHLEAPEGFGQIGPHGRAEGAAAAYYSHADPEGTAGPSAVLLRRHLRHLADHPSPPESARFIRLAGDYRGSAGTEKEVPAMGLFDKIRNKSKMSKGHVKEKTGRAVGQPDLEAR